MKVSHPIKTDVGSRVDPGRYHFEVVSIEDTKFEKNGNPCTKLQLRVCNGANPEMVNRLHTESIAHYSDKEKQQQMNQSQICLLAIKTGCTFNGTTLATKESIEATIDTEEDVVFDWGLAAGAHFVGELEPSYDEAEKDKKSKKFCRLRHGAIWETTDPAVADVPKDEKAIEAAAAANTF